MSHDSRLSEVPVRHSLWIKFNLHQFIFEIFDEKLVWAGKSKLKDTTWQNIHHQPKKSKVQVGDLFVHETRNAMIHLTDLQ